MYPNSALAAWQLALMIIVPLASLFVWLTAVFVASRQPNRRAHRASVILDLATEDDLERQDKLAA
jgi:hypothetical protein